MRRVLSALSVWALLLAPALPAQAEENVAGTVAVPPAGYVFDRPEVLAAQLQWGVAHGARLLALACSGSGSGRGAAAEAWVDWQEREQGRIGAAGRLLSQYYFGASAAGPAAIAAALGLKAELALAPEALADACDTLATALTTPRYDLARLRAATLDALNNGTWHQHSGILK
jgi:hypothetical protein